MTLRSVIVALSDFLVGLETPAAPEPVFTPVLTVCDGWANPRHSRRVLSGDSGGIVSHGMCAECQEQIEYAIAMRETLRTTSTTHAGASRVDGGIVLLAIVAMLAATPVAAEPLTIPASVFAGGLAADSVSTWHALSRGAVEANPLLPRSAPMIVATKAVVGTMVILLAQRLHATGHGRIARVVLYAGGGVSVAAAAHNGAVAR